MSRTLKRASGAGDLVPIGTQALAALGTLEAELGGRTGILAALALAPLTRDTRYFQGLLADPANQQVSLLEICRLADLQPGTVLRLIQAGLTATSSLRAQYAIATRTPAVVKDLMHRAAPHIDACTNCQGIGTTTADPSPDQPNPSPEPCEACGGTGQLQYSADPECRRLALDLSGLLPKAGGIQITNQQLALAGQGGDVTGSLGGGELERFQEAMDQVLFGGGSASLPAAQTFLDPPPASAPSGVIDVTPD
jgi:hypothetical protein